MQVDGGRRNGISSAHLLSEGLVDGILCRETNGYVSSSSTGSVSPSRVSSSGVGNSIEHRVSKMDTLAGLAIKYGVEVADIKRMNSLATDLQMFAHEKLQIPLPGRHHLSKNSSTGSYDNGVQNSPRGHQNIEPSQLPKLKPPQPPSRRVSTAMRRLQGYYGLAHHKKEITGEGTELAVYRTGGLDLENGLLRPVSPATEPLPSCHGKSRSLVNEFLPENGELVEDAVIADAEDNGDVDRSCIEKSVRRRQKADGDSSCGTPNISIKGENGGAFAGRAAKTPVKPKSASKADLDSARKTNVPIGDIFMANSLFTVRRSSSTSNLQDSCNSSLWPTTKWSLKADAMARPLFDGLSKPTTTRGKTALD